METVDVTRVSSKGQLVIPGEIRDALGIVPGTKFMVWGEGDTVLLKKIGRPSSEEIRKLFAESRRLARSVGLKKSDVRKAIAAVRRKK